MQNPYAHLIKAPHKQEGLLKLTSEAQKAVAAFEKEQAKVDAINANLERNHATILALEAENKKLEEQANQVNVDQFGAVDFSGYDVLSGEVFKNNGKIEKLREVIARFEKEREYTIYTSWRKAEKEMRIKAREVYDYVAETLLSELLEEKGETLQRIFSLLYQWSGSGQLNEQPAYIAIKNAMKPYLEYDQGLKTAIFNFPTASREINNKILNMGGMRLRKEVEYLKEELGKE